MTHYLVCTPGSDCKEERHRETLFFTVIPWEMRLISLRSRLTVVPDGSGERPLCVGILYSFGEERLKDWKIILLHIGMALALNAR